VYTERHAALHFTATLLLAICYILNGPLEDYSYVGPFGPTGS